MIDAVSFWQYGATRDLVELAPLAKQRGASLGIARLHLLDVQDPIGTEIPKVGAKLAPAHQHARLIEIHQGEWPHDAPRVSAVAIHVSKIELSLCTDRGT